MHNNRFKVVLLDADDTVFDFITCERTAILKTAEAFNLKADINDAQFYSSINLSFWKQLEQGIVTREELKVRRFEKWFEYLCVYHIDPVAFGVIYEDNLSRTGILIEGAEEFVQRLSQNASVYIVTNGLYKCQTGRISTSPIKKYIKGMFISEEVGFTKPDKRFFDKVLKALDIKDKSDVIIIGDSLSSDMQGGRNAGITTCLYCPDNSIDNHPLCDYIITDYNQFFEIV